MITSAANESIKAIRKLRDRKYRDETSTAYIEGIRIVLEAVKQQVEIERIILAESFTDLDRHREIVESFLSKGIVVTKVTNDVFRSISLKERPQGISAVVHQQWKPIHTITNTLKGVWVCLWEVADPGNLGTILRTMDAVNATGIILAGNCTDPYDPAAIRAAMGATFTKTLVKSSLNDLIGLIKGSKIFTVGTSDSAEKHYRDVRYCENMVLTMGSERQGMPQELQEACSTMVKLPMLGSCDSLNLAVTTGVILYEILEQNRPR